ncbi:HAD family hydrolase [Pseudonocardia endophytica]|uniref:Putative hydrolase of the HAD superfamily n=1 Tax=Pseudonocardia endophytica TaxID=401976 RepID=A0A4V2PIK3_PSEEN|nr:HAD-IA family hydrolase [Pseudonocardia endophytica]TCK25016.1 putative hydrolase of the HAD superfamily [Pseudonocardia endophytica]
MSSPTATTVVFDLGEVLVPSEGLTRMLATELGVSEADAGRAYWAHRVPHDRGEPPMRYWTAVFGDLGLPADPGLMERVEALDSARWATLPSASTMLIAELARAKVRMALLSNAPRGLAAAVRASAWSSPFDRLLFSADVGVSKPSPDIYRRADLEFRTRPEDVVFFDDRADNVRAARAHGWDAHIWRGIPSAMETLRARGLSLAARGIPPATEPG